MTTKLRKTHRGGKREGAGRPVGTGKYGEPTKAVRIPQSLVEHVHYFLTHYGQTKNGTLPLPDNIVKAEDFLARRQASERSQQPQNFNHEDAHSYRLPLFDSKVAAGFPSPADDHMETHLDLNEYVIRNPATTFYVRVQGESMKNVGIFPNDLLVVDRSLKASDGSIIIAFVDGEFTVKRLRFSKNKEIWLLPENEAYPPLLIKKEMEFQVWGVVTNVIHSFTHKL